jgi:hypothetical protein
MIKKPPKYESERHPLDHVLLFPYKFQSLKPLAGNSIKPRTLSQELALGSSLKTWLSEALSHDLALGRSVKTWISDPQSRPGSRTLSVMTWLSHTLRQDLIPHELQATTF